MCNDATLEGRKEVLEIITGSKRVQTHLQHTFVSFQPEKYKQYSSDSREGGILVQPFALN